MIELDGSFGEGGGQILRSSLALSLLTDQPFRLRNIRARRPKPGLAAQHLQSVLACASISNASVRGASLGSSDLEFEPGTVQAGNYVFSIGTAGATGLVLHAIYLPLALRAQATSEIRLVGGTHVSTSPTFPFLNQTWSSYLELMGLSVRLELYQPGFYPRGGGVIRAILQPIRSLQPLTLHQRGEFTITGISAVAGLDASIARRQAHRAKQLLSRHDLEADIRLETWEGGPGTVLQLTVHTKTLPVVFVGLGARGKPAETVASEAVDELLHYLHTSEALVDPHSADQLVLPLSFAEGPSEFETSQITNHLITNIAVIQRFLSRDIELFGELGQPGRVRIH